MSKKLSLFLILILSVLSFGTLMNKDAHAAVEDNATVILHKEMFENIPRPPTQNTGEEMNGFDGLGVYAGGIEFKVYDVTDDFYARRSIGDTVDEAIKYVSKLTPESVPKTGVTDDEGELTFDLPKMSNGWDAVYLFTESPKEDIRLAANMVLAFPVYAFRDGKYTNEELDTVHLYPKNELIEEVLTFEKNILEKKASYEVGEEITFQMKTKVPMYPRRYEYYVIRDVGMELMKFVEGSLTLSIDGVEKENLYTLRNRVNGFLLEFDLDRMDEFAGKEMLITYTMFLEEGAIPDRGYRNFGELEYDDNLLTDWEEVRTGGYRFLKVDRRNQENTLADAHFILRNNNDRYLHVINGMYEWRMDKDTATIIESAEDGTFEVTGLKYGQYSLEEVKAPEGYILSNTPIDFEVEVNTYNPGAVMNIINEPRMRLPITGGEVPRAPEAVPTEIAKRPALKLPFTGFYNNMWFSILGLVFISTALFINYKAEKREEE